MKLASLEAIFSALQDAQARYLVAGGVAVVAYGYQRFTQDLDLVLDFTPASLNRSLRALQSLGYRPIIVVPIEDLADPAIRQKWAENHNMEVFSLVSDIHPDVTIDIFIKELFPFDAEYERAPAKVLGSNVRAKVVSLPALIDMKRKADRHKDRDDIEQLRRLNPESQPDS